MKRVVNILFVTVLTMITAQAQEYKIITTVESIVPSGLGRSRIIDANADRDYKEFSSVQTADDNTRNKADRSDIRDPRP